jgi:hypothetical protein
LIQNVFINFSEASAASVNSQARAIDQAKIVAENLRSYTKTDPNRSYILFRVNELEFQIHLEEEEVRMKREYERQKAVNILVEVFNEEVGKWRPTFSNLILIRERMEDLDRRKADELQSIIVRRVQNISREVVNLLDIALANRDFNKVHKEFEYIRGNRKYFNVSSQKYGGYEDKIFAITNADSLTQYMDFYIGEISQFLKKNDFTEALRRNEDLKYRIKKAQPWIASSQYGKNNTKQASVEKDIAQKEDSLVAVNLQIVQSGSVEGAIDYLDMLRAYGISNDKIQIVDRAIMKVPSQQKNLQAEKRAEKDILTLSQNQKSGRFDMDNVKSRVQEKTDSIRLANGLPANSYISAPPQSSGGNSGAEFDNEEPEFGKNQKKAQYFSEKIYTLLSDSEPDKAYKKFSELRSPLKKYLEREDFVKLEKAVLTAHKGVTKGIITPEKESLRKSSDQKKMEEQVIFLITEIYGLIDKSDFTSAYQSFKKNQQMIKQYAGKEAYDVLKTSIDEAAEAKNQ